eukprot:NODE_2576_length_1143_cov_84.479331_g2456_i0.p1 GENE.NODE_2576_length_1143_cov_84.479331_g2456_i0~~NODE_2576_length_1143_cov_84.479331_g2456_i0.p1  ORF type:complete len:311 (-),score=93.56 NODE_2576_length_1143_cov_84.479331_g2456_i0:153-1085(-)
MLRPSAKGAGQAARKPSKLEIEEAKRAQRLWQQQQRLQKVQESEMDEFFATQVNNGVCFRRGLMAFCLLVTLLLVFLKWDKETNLYVENSEPEANKEEEDLRTKYETMLRVTKEDRKEKMEEQYQKLSEELQKSVKQDPGCKDCKNQLVELTNAYNALSSVVANPYHKVLDLPKKAGFHQIKRAFEKEKSKAERGESNYELAEIKEAFDIMSYPESRAFYELYGRKPPASMKHQQKMTHGGWGVEIGMGTFKYAIMKAWLEYFDNGWVDVAFFGVIFLVLGVKVWNNKDDLMAKIEQIEAMERSLAEPEE